MRPLNLLVIARPNAHYLSVLDQLPDSTRVIKGTTLDELRDHAETADVILNGMNRGELLREIFPLARNVRWVHSLSAGVENALNPELIASPVPVTNARGVFKDSLGEFVLTAMLFFAKDIPRMRRNQREHRWEEFDVDVLYRQTMGVVGYGEIGRAAAARAHALGTKILAIRRRPELSVQDPIVSKVYSIENRVEMIAECDYVVLATPKTPDTDNLVGEREIAAMKPNAVIINVGRGSAIDEKALIRALQEKRIRGAGLDVFAEEPLPPDHPFWDMENVLISPHTSDHTYDWLESATQFFVTNFKRFANGEPLLNVVDKKAGY